MAQAFQPAQVLPAQLGKAAPPVIAIAKSFYRLEIMAGAQIAVPLRNEKTFDNGYIKTCG